MSIKQRSPCGIAVTAAAIALGCSTMGGVRAEDSAAQPSRGIIRIEYVPPKNPDHQHLYDLLKERHALEILQSVFSPFRLPVDVTFRTLGCDGVPDAWYQRYGEKLTVSLCYEYLQEILQAMPKETTPAGVSPRDAVVGQLFFAFAHEFGHLAFDAFDLPILGREEDAADQFATYMMLQFRDGRALRLIKGAAYAYRELVKDYKKKPNVTLPLAHFSSDHGLPQQRFANLLCIAYGYDAKEFAEVADNEYLPAYRLKRCRYEYLILRNAVRQLIAPHIDKEAAQKVLNARWLPEVDKPPRAH